MATNTESVTAASGDAGAAQEPPRSLGRDAWEDLRKRPLFIMSLVLIIAFVLMAIVPGLFTNKDPYACDLLLSRQGPQKGAWFGYDSGGCDVYANTVYGARASMIVGLVTTTVTTLLGSTIGTIAGFKGGRIDSLLSRLADVFFSIPFLLGGLLVLTSFPSDENTPAWQTIGKVVLALSILGWPSIMRLMRSSVIQVRGADYVTAARALGAPSGRIIMKHIVPNAISPVIAVATISLGGYIVSEATLSFLGVGLQPPIISWGAQISMSVPWIRVAPHMLLFPALFLSLCVLAFMMLGDAVKDALDPKLR